MVGPKNAVLGSQNMANNQQENITADSDESRAELRAAAEFSQTPQFEAIKKVIQTKVSYWQQFVPGGSGEILAGDAVDIKQLSNEERGWRWLAADCVIHELNGIVNAYEQAAELLKDEATK